jgi:hypothetical protein
MADQWRDIETRPAVSPLAILTVRAEARAILWEHGELNLHQAVDAWQAAAESDGLVAQYGQDQIQDILAEAFGRVRRD